MRFEKQVKLRLDERIERDGYVDVEGFKNEHASRLMTDALPAEIWPERKAVEAILRSAFGHFIAEAIDDMEEESELTDIFIRGGGERFYEYIIKKDDENGERLAQKHCKATYGSPDHVGASKEEA